MTQSTIGFNKDRAFALLSFLHKYIRRGRAVPAMLTGLELAKMAPSMFWAEIKVIAVEDVAQPLEIVAVDALSRQFGELKDQFGKGLLWVADACKILAEAKKDRRADEVIQLLKVPSYAPARELLNLGEPVPESVLFDKHTAEGRAKGRGYTHFVEEASRCENMSAEYERWTGLWVEVMRLLPAHLRAGLE